MLVDEIKIYKMHSSMKGHERNFWKAQTSKEINMVWINIFTFIIAVAATKRSIFMSHVDNTMTMIRMNRHNHVYMNINSIFR